MSGIIEMVPESRPLKTGSNPTVSRNISSNA